MTPAQEAGGSTVALAVDARAATVAEADHVVHRLDELLDAVAPERPAYVASTHVVEAGDRHVAVAASWQGTADREALVAALAEAFGEAAAVVAGEAPAGAAALAGSARAALEEHTTRRAGRLARFPGQEAVERRTTVGEAVAASCVDEVAGLAGTDVRPDTVVDLTGFARPVWREGRCVLVVQQARDALVAFEQQHQIACCADH